MARAGRPSPLSPAGERKPPLRERATEEELELLDEIATVRWSTEANAIRLGAANRAFLGYSRRLWSVESAVAELRRERKRSAMWQRLTVAIVRALHARGIFLADGPSRSSKCSSDTRRAGGATPKAS